MKVWMMALMFACFTVPQNVHSETLSWDLPLGIGTVQLPFQSTELLGGRDFILKETIAGFSTPVATFWKEIDVQVGAVGEPEERSVEPYLGFGVDIKKHIPLLSELTSLHINAFARYDTTEGKFGSGLSASYRFGQ